MNLHVFTDMHKLNLRTLVWVYYFKKNAQTKTLPKLKIEKS